MKIAIIGAGAWGTALGVVLHRNSHEITVWGHDAEHLREMQRTARNEAYLPGVSLAPDWRFETDIAAAIEGMEAIVLAVPSRALREVSARFAAYQGLVVCVTKGIEADSGLTMTGILRETVQGATAVALSGPSLAAEVVRGVPTAVVAAHPDTAIASRVQNWFHGGLFRVYTSPDILGVELSGALKNVVAIGAGVCDGLGFGDNSKAALITRALVELTRIGLACQARAETFSGLSGLGDLVVTCFSKLSRNRTLGERLGRGESLRDIVASTRTVAEGIPTARSAYQLARRLNVVTPIIDEVYGMLYEGRDVKTAIQTLMSRDSKPE
jgi:glycerol-3-phosphate dehydrogenase (NAD(P)+)